MKKSFYLLLLLLSGLLLTANAQTKVYVTEAGAGVKTGTSWANAYDNTQLQTAIDQASSLATVANPVQVWVAKGAYRPVYVGGGNFFKMYNNVAIYGGFAGGESNLSQRNFRTNECRLDQQDPGTGTIFKNQNINATAILDGFSFIPDPNVMGTGGKFYNEDGLMGTKPTIRNCKLYHVSNQARNGYECSPTYINCEINQSDYDSGLAFGNTADGTSSKNNTQYINCLFSQNSTKRGFANNATNNGQANVGYISCTIFQNYIGLEGAFVSITTDGTGSAKATLRNCIVWGNRDKNGDLAQIYTFGTGASADVQYSDIQGGYTGMGNINTDPLFVNQYYANLRLRNPCSPCINTGKSLFNPQSTDFDGLTRVVGGQIDMGAYENADPNFTASILYVTTTGAGDKSGTSWANASDDLQVMIDLGTCVAAKSGSAVQVWVAKGIYKSKPHAGFLHLNNKVEVYGGFVGNETQLNQRNFKTNVCQLSSNDGSSGTMQNTGVDATAILDGFLFAPNPNDPNPHSASRLFNYTNPTSNCNPVYRNCTFANQLSAGGALTTNSSGDGHECTPTFLNCVFQNNSGIASFFNSAVGAGSKTDAKYINCSFINNAFRNSTIFNEAFETGSATTTLINCTVAGNSNYEPSYPGGIINYTDGMAGSSAKIVLRNTIVWGNVNSYGNPTTINNNGSGTTVDAQYSDIQGGGYAGTGNINTDPLFANPATFDVHLLCGSPCVNVGNNAANVTTTDLDGQPRVAGSTIDMGVYEGATIANFSASATLDCLANKIMLTASSNGSYMWTGPANFSSTQQNPSISSISDANSGVYSVRLTNSLSCSATATTSLSILNPAMQGTISSNSPVCVGLVLDLKTTANGQGYTWQGPGAWSSNLKDPSRGNMSIQMSGVYTLAVKGSSGCTGTNTISVVVVNKNSVSASSNSPVAQGATIQLSANGGLAYSKSYQWGGPSFSSTLQNPTRPNAIKAYGGKYLVTFNGACGTATASVSVIVNGSGREANAEVVNLIAESQENEIVAMTVSPNPTDGRMEVVVKTLHPATLLLQLNDEMGREVNTWQLAEQTNDHRVALDISQQRQGLYLLRANIGGKSQVKRVLKVDK